MHRDAFWEVIVQDTHQREKDLEKQPESAVGQQSRGEQGHPPSQEDVVYDVALDQRHRQLNRAIDHGEEEKWPPGAPKSSLLSQKAD